MKRYNLIVVWDTGEKEVFPYETEEEAERAEKGYKTAFGNQVSFTCINRA